MNPPPSGAGRGGDRLSGVLGELLHRAEADLTLGALVRHTEGRSVFLLVILLCLPFITPIHVPGFSIPFGLVVMLLGWRLARHHHGRLPRRLDSLPLPVERFGRVLRGSVRVLGFLERLVRTRGGAWTRWTGFFKGNCLVISWLGFLLALPLPVPFSNTFTAQGAVVMALATLERDGRVVWIGYALTLLATAYIGLSLFGGWVAVHRIGQWLGWGDGA